MHLNIARLLRKVALLQALPLCVCELVPCFSEVGLSLSAAARPMPVGVAVTASSPARGARSVLQWGHIHKIERKGKPKRVNLYILQKLKLHPHHSFVAFKSLTK